VSSIENNIEELGQSVKFKEKLKKIWLEHKAIITPKKEKNLWIIHIEEEGI
jgi:hypothetical protein